MADGSITVPWAALGGVGAALSGAAAWLAKSAGSARREERDECSKQIGLLRIDFDRRLSALELSELSWRERWTREVEARVRAYNAEAPAAPMRPPLPSYTDEPTGVRNVRALIESAERD